MNGFLYTIKNCEHVSYNVSDEFIYYRSVSARKNTTVISGTVGTYSTTGTLLFFVGLLSVWTRIF